MKNIFSGLTLAFIVMLSLPSWATVIDSGNVKDYSLRLSGEDNTTRWNSEQAGLIFWNPKDWKDPVWQWDEVNMNIKGSTGSTYISGEMRQIKLDKNGAYIQDGEVWSFDLTLNNMSSMHNSFRGPINDSTLTKLLSGKETSAMSRSELGIGWNSSLLNVYDSKGILWSDLSGKDQHNNTVASLHFDTLSNQLVFRAEYHNSEFTGSTMAQAQFEGSISFVREPGTIVLILMGIACLVASRRKKWMN